MRRRTMLGWLCTTPLACTKDERSSTGAASPVKASSAVAEDATLPPVDLNAPPPTSDRVQLSEAAWRARLSPEAFRVLREEGTERAFTGDLYDEKRDGTYVCAGCGNPLYHSRDKYDSGTGWPSFTRPIEEGRIATETDRSLGMVRVECHCARCGGHQGHIFDDGPPPTGKRHCINSVSLTFHPS